jgi:hypothetical protein
VRVVKKADLLDVSIVTFPFYSKDGSTSAEARAAAKLNVTHGVLEAVAYMRKAAQSVAGIFFRADSSPIDFASRLTRCHEQAELACMTAERCYDEMGDDQDGDPDDEVLRAHLRNALVTTRHVAGYFANARLRHASNMSKTQQAKLLGRGR